MIRALVLILVVVCLIFQTGLTMPSRVSIIRPVSVVREFEYIRWQVQIDPRDENRALVVAAVDGDVVRQTKEQLDGDRAPRTRWIEWKYGLPAGDYIVVAALFNSTREVARASVPVSVIARF